MAEIKNKGGRPPKYKTPEELEAKCNEYFEQCDKVEYFYNEDGTPLLYKGEPVVKKKATPYTISGLALFLGFSNRSSVENFLRYGGSSYQEPELPSDKETTASYSNIAFRDVITRAITRINDYREKALYFKESCTGAKFALACNGWSDKQPIDVNIKHEGAIVSASEAVDRLAELGFSLGKTAKSIQEDAKTE